MQTTRAGVGRRQISHPVLTPPCSEVCYSIESLGSWCDTHSIQQMAVTHTPDLAKRQIFYFLALRKARLSQLLKPALAAPWEQLRRRGTAPSSKHQHLQVAHFFLGSGPERRHILVLASTTVISQRMKLSGTGLRWGEEVKGRGEVGGDTECLIKSTEESAIMPQHRTYYHMLH